MRYLHNTHGIQRGGWQYKPPVSAQCWLTTRFFIIALVSATGLFSFPGHGQDLIDRLLDHLSPPAALEVVESYLQAKKRRSFGDIYALLYSDDQELISERQYIRAGKKSYLQFRSFANASRYEVLEVIETSNEAIAIVIAHLPDIQNFVRFTRIAASQKKDIDRYMAEQIKNKEISIVKNEIEIQLVLENRHWRIIEGL